MWTCSVLLFVVFVMHMYDKLIMMVCLVWCVCLELGGGVFGAREKSILYKE